MFWQDDLDLSACEVVCKAAYPHYIGDLLCSFRFTFHSPLSLLRIFLVLIFHLPFFVPPPFMAL
jgi:hypothetical protein